MGIPGCVRLTRLDQLIALTPHHQFTTVNRSMRGDYTHSTACRGALRRIWKAIEDRGRRSRLEISFCVTSPDTSNAQESDSLEMLLTIRVND